MEAEMSRLRTHWVCQSCGFQSAKSLGRCTECCQWNCLVEEPAETRQLQSDLSFSPDGLEPVLLWALPEQGEERMTTGLGSFDRVVGGGIVAGSVLLLAGDPGIGKSTLALQIAKAAGVPTLYAAAEESPAAVRMRAQRLSIGSERISVYGQQDVLRLAKTLASCGCRIAIVDSIQSVYHGEIASAPGSVSQVRESAAVLLRAAKAADIALILIGHVTKDGAVAGPRVLEHMVDCVLQFEGETRGPLRVLRARKNRFGSTDEIAFFTMESDGLAAVVNPAAFFLRQRLETKGGGRSPSGTAVIAPLEGSQPYLLEVQALVGPAGFVNPRRVVNGFSHNRLLQILAVLERRAGLPLSRHDIYLNLAGGFDVSDPAGDLGAAAAVATSFLDRSVDPQQVVIGEIGLAGEIRPVEALERRLKEALNMGFKKAVVPAGNLPLNQSLPGITVTGVQLLLEALKAIMPGEDFSQKERLSGEGIPAT